VTRRPAARPPVRGLVLLISFLFVTVHAVAAADPPLTLDEYQARLAAIDAAVDAGDTAWQWPAEWRVRVGDGEVVVPTAVLKREFAAAKERHDADARSRLLARLDVMQSEAVAAAEASHDTRAEHDRLASILRASEFNQVRGPTWRDRLTQAIVNLLVRVFSLPIVASSIPTIGRLFVYALIFGAVLLVAWSTNRYIRESAQIETILSTPLAPPTREWQAWLADAQAAATNGDWRQAMHFAYWCAVAHLEARRFWRPDRARTPREYVRQLPPASPERASLAELTGRFERVWYGMAKADAEMFSDALAHLKKMGCPVG